MDVVDEIRNFAARYRRRLRAPLRGIKMTDPDEATRSVDNALLLLNAVDTGIGVEAGNVVDVLRTAIRLLSADLPEDDRLRGYASMGLCQAYFLMSTYVATDDMDHLDRAVEAGRTALTLLAGDPDGRRLVFSKLGNALIGRYLKNKDDRDISDAMTMLGSNARAIFSDQPLALLQLSAAHEARYDLTFLVEDLVTAHALTGRALEAHHPGSAMSRDRLLANVAVLKTKLFAETGQLNELDQALDLFSESMRGLPEFHVDRAQLCSMMAGCRHLMYLHTGVLSDLDAAVDFHEQALRSYPPGHPGIVGALINLATSCQTKLGRVEDEALEKSTFELINRALRSAAGDERSAALNLGGLMLKKRFIQNQRSGDIDDAIKAFRSAVGAATSGERRAVGLHNEATALLTRYQSSTSREDLLAASRAAVKSMESSKPDHPDTAQRIARVAECLHEWLALSDRRGIREMLHDLVDRLHRCASAAPMHQVRTRQQLALLAAGLGEHRIAVTLLDEAIELLPGVAPRESDWPDQEHRFGGHHDLVSEAVAAHCAAGDAAGAVRAVQRGRALLLAGVMNERGDPGGLDLLEHRHPALAQQFRDRSAVLRGGTTGSARTRRRWRDEYDEVVNRIREVPGHENFLRFEDEWPELAADEAVVLVNSATYRGDAIVLTAGAPPRVVALPDLHHDETTLCAFGIRLVTTGEDDDLTAQLPLSRVLDWLWTTVAEPLLPHLPAVALPRVWWLPLGLMGMLPIHAAAPEGRPGLLEAVVSSYTPTLSALATKTSPTGHHAQLVVAVAGAGDLSDLPRSTRYALELHASTPGLAPLVDGDATPGRVLAALPAAGRVHFACHAEVDLTIPSRSGLRLADGARLPLTDIVDLHLPHADFAYLSACDTAAAGLRHSDTAITTASVFQLAGFAGVVASSWPLKDVPAARAAAAFYRYLDDRTYAEALRLACVELRDRYPDKPEIWAALMHSGR
ncbi:CHAT domain-containing protein [Saccharothrix lopnurensis]|uniref:CHAT domain-containing protein n=1 Tax=Saccharothrix lopnurensis TaxID=1670621 RepID=A0ABW1P5Y3_9PSEU